MQRTLLSISQSRKRPQQMRLKLGIFFPQLKTQKIHFCNVFFRIFLPAISYEGDEIPFDQTNVSEKKEAKNQKKAEKKVFSTVINKTRQYLRIEK